jgi:nicotinamide mononucleotide transporter
MLDSTYIHAHWLEWFGVITGLLYLWLEIRQHPSMWVVGFLSSMVYVVVFFQNKLYADMSLNTYYLAVSVYGFWKWKMEKQVDPQSTEITYQLVNPRIVAQLIIVFLLLYFCIHQVLKHYTDSNIPSQDALMTSLSMIATWMLAKRYIQHWFVWIAVNGFAVYLFVWKGLYPTAFLFLIYSLLSGYGFWEWKKHGTKRTLDS